MVPYTKVNPSHPEVREMESRLAQTFQSIVLNPLLQNIQIVTQVVLTSGVDTAINHKLGKAVTGWVIIDKNAYADIKQSATANPIPKSSIILVSNATVTVSILFF